MIDVQTVAAKILAAGHITCDASGNVLTKSNAHILEECGDELELVTPVINAARKIHVLTSDDTITWLSQESVTRRLDVRPREGFFADANKSRTKSLAFREILTASSVDTDAEDMRQLSERTHAVLLKLYPPPPPAVTYNDPLAFGKARVVAKHKIQITNLNEMYYMTSDGCREDLSATLLKDMVTEEVCRYNMQKPKKAPAMVVDGVYKGLMNYANNVKDELLQEARANLRFDPSCVAAAEHAFLEIIHRMSFKQDDDIALLGLKQLLWQAKRYMFRYETKYEMWVQILAEGGVGKNVVLREILFKPIQPWYLETELSKLEDFDREVVKFRSALMINFDELAKGSSPGSDLNPGRGADTLRKLKAIMTRPEFSVRELGTQNQMKFRKTFAFCSTANVPISTVFGDDSGTGNRRFLELESTSPRGIHWEMEHLFDVGELLWRSIDENNGEGYVDYGTPLGLKLQAIQNTYEAHNSISAWFDDECEVLDEGDTGSFVQLKHLYPHYAAWAKRYGYGVFQLTSFSTWMRKRFKAVTNAKLVTTINVTLKNDEEVDSV